MICQAVEQPTHYLHLATFSVCFDANNNQESLFFLTPTSLSMAEHSNRSIIKCFKLNNSAHTHEYCQRNCQAIMTREVSVPVKMLFHNKNISGHK